MKLPIVCLMGGALMPLFLSGCGSTYPLVFADKTTVGLEVSGGEGVPELVFGFKTKSVAIVPIAVRRKDGSGGVAEIVPIQGEAGGGIKDAYSTFGNFTFDSDVNATTASLGLGRFFATGVAAQEISKKLGEAWVEKAKK
jgi:hypothetical protein